MGSYAEPTPAQSDEDTGVPGPLGFINGSQSFYGCADLELTQSVSVGLQPEDSHFHSWQNVSGGFLACIHCVELSGQFAVLGSEVCPEVVCGVLSGEEGGKFAEDSGFSPEEAEFFQGCG